MITVEKTHLKCVILFYSKIPVQIHKTMIFCSHLNLKPPPLSKSFSQGYAFHLGNILSTTAPDPFHAKANEKGPRTPQKSPYLQQREYTASQSSLETLVVLAYWGAQRTSHCTDRKRERDCQVHHKHTMKHKETQQDRCELECVRVHPQLHVLVHFLWH